MTTRLIRSPLLAALSLATALLAARPASADDGDRTRARELMNQGNALLAKDDYTGALGKFQAAYDAYPSPKLLLNIGTALRGLGRNAEAANAYARWIRARQNPQQVAEVEEVLKDLDRKVAQVEVKPSPAGARVSIDARPVAPANLGVPIRLEPGTHTVKAEKAGYQAASQEIALSAGEKRTVELELEAEAPSPTATPEKEVTEPTSEPEDHEDVAVSAGPEGGSPGRGLRIAGLSAGGLGLVALAVGVKFGLDAKNISDELDDESAKLAQADQPWSKELIDKQDEGDSAQTKFIAFTAIGAGAVVAGGVLYYLGYSSQPDAERSLVLAPTFTGSSAGWALAGSF